MRIDVRMFSAISVLFVTCILLQDGVNSVPTFQCFPGEALEITLDTAVDSTLSGFYATIANSTTCDSTDAEQAQLETTSGTIQKTNITCHNLTIGEAGVFLLMKNFTLQTEREDVQSIEYKCTLRPNATYEYNIAITADPTVASLTGDYVFDDNIEVGPPELGVNEQITIKASLDEDTRKEVFVRLEHVEYQIVDDPIIVELVSDGCVNATYVPSTIEAMPADVNTAKYEVTHKHNAFILFQTGASSAVDVILRIILEFCPAENPNGCYNPTGCDNNPEIGRRRRQAANDELQRQEITRRIKIWPTKEAQREDVYERMEYAGIPRASTMKEGDICVNKTVTAVLLGLLLIAMAVCLISSVIMFVRLRKTQKEKLIKSDNSYSNKGF